MERPMYSYRLLDPTRQEIRLLVVHPAASSSSELVHCTLQHVGLGPRPVYETISYVWGDQSKHGLLTANDTILDVPQSAEVALRRMRLSDEDRRLWIDAVCINQRDIEERSTQVAMMGDIYSGTTRNLVWLGEEDGTSETAIRAPYAVLEDMRGTTVNFTNAIDTLYGADGVPRSATRGLEISFDEAAIRAFFTKPWFTRCWVMQEAVLAPENVCHVGQHKLELDLPLNVASWLAYKYAFKGISYTSAPGLTGALRVAMMKNWYTRRDITCRDVSLYLLMESLR